MPHRVSSRGKRTDRRGCHSPPTTPHTSPAPTPKAPQAPPNRPDPTGDSGLSPHPRLVTRGAAPLPARFTAAMSVFHDEVEIEDFEYDEETATYSYPCPCGDRFLITREDLENGEDVATCPSCSLILRVIYDQEQFMRDEVIAEPLTNKELIKC
uniref:Diphthamide biosynthesis protein 3 n=7 Tax=Neoaves TaxID=3078114 RepID=A0A8B9FXR3_9PSIT